MKLKSGIIRFTRRRLLHSYFMLIIVWAIVIFLMHNVIGGWFPILWFGPSRKFDHDQLKRLMASVVPDENSTTLFANPLWQLLVPDNNFVHFFSLPKRKSHIIYGELTSANRDSRFPLAPDFTFHIDYFPRHVVLYEGYGPACIYRIYIYPSLPNNFQVLLKMTSRNLSAIFLVMEFDGKPVLKFSLQKLAEANEWPFIYPLSTKHSSLASGIGAYTPFCYQKSLRLIYENDRNFPDDLLDLNINCTANELLCPVHIYSAVSSHKFPVGMSVSSGFCDASTAGDKLCSDISSRVVELLKNPELNGPSAGEPCTLSCFEMCSRCQRVLYHRIHSAAVITSLRIRVFVTATGLLSPNWTDLFFTAYFDNSSSPRFYQVPLGSLFGATASMNDLSGAAFGKRSMHCDYEDPHVNFKRKTITGYFYFPMPYWHEALLIVEGADSLEASVSVCFQITTVDNFYDPSQTGYLHGVKTYYSGNVEGWRKVLDVSGGWGHVVSLLMEVDNLVPVHDVPLAYRWAALQADPVIHIDHSASATVLGSGLEDYFSYAHGFAGAANTTYAFVGVHHIGRPTGGASDPQTWHCYRQHVLDSIAFRSGIRFFMEGTGSKFSSPADPLGYREHRRLVSARLPALAHTVIYYFRQHSSSSSASFPVSCDRIWLGNTTSEHEHQFLLVGRSVSASGGRQFTLSDLRRRFIGDTSRNRTWSFAGGRAFSTGDAFRFELAVRSLSGEKTFRLQRTSYSAPRRWNDRARWSVNGVDQGVWFVPMGSLSEEYSLVNDDRILLRHQLMTSGESDSAGGAVVARFEFRPLSGAWNDIGYELCPELD